jgi:hypothetical protein
MHAHAGGKLLFRVLPKTIYGRRLILSVTHRRGSWAAVTTFLVPNGRRTWVHVDRRRFAVRRTRWRLESDLSERTLTVLHGTEAVRTLRVAIGTRATPTPPGTYAVTDKLDGRRFGSSYGCCILALSGHQTNTPAGWQGGDRLAIHGTNNPGSIGVPSSAGCLHADAEDLKVLMRKVPLGTPVFIRA